MARRWASVAQVAEYVGWSRNTVRHHISTGYITGYRIGGSIRIDLNELDALVQPVGGGQHAA